MTGKAPGPHRGDESGLATLLSARPVYYAGNNIEPGITKVILLR
jgi:hypothetical protein